MWAYMRVTLKEAVLSPVSWGLCVMGAFFGWFATAVAILAVAEIESQSRELIESTSQLFGALLTLSLIGRSLEEDSSSGFALAGDATRGGPRGRLLGRWLGAVLAGIATTLLVALLITAAGTIKAPELFYLLYTTILTMSLVGAWSTLVSSQWGGAAGALVTLLLWVLGHFPWGTDPFLGGGLGRALGAWLPGPQMASIRLQWLGYTPAAVAGLLLLALALARPAEPRA